jgi:nucleoside-diphosphate-sugar epimerase
MNVTILGASGLVGATIFEHLRATGRYEVRPVIHSSSGKAARVARFNIDLTMADVRSLESVKSAIKGTTHVINCTAGSNDVLVRGMKNIIAACRSCGVERLVHLSSVLVYGDRPDPATAHEGARPRPSPGYAAAKLHQDQLAAAAVRRGLPVVTLCIPIVSGPYSTYLPELLIAMRHGTLPLVEGGTQPINLIDARNLAVALERALVCRRADARRMFVTDGSECTWRQLVDALMPLAQPCPPLSAMTRQQATALTAEGSLTMATRRAIARVLQLDEVRAIVKNERPLANTYSRLVDRIEASPRWLQDRLMALAQRLIIDAPQQPAYSLRLVKHQLRSVRHSINMAERELGYVPAFDFEASMTTYRTWYATMYGYGGPFWDLYRRLA